MGYPGLWCWPWGPQGLLQVPGTSSAGQMVFFTWGVLDAGVRKPGRACSWPSSQLSLMSCFVGKSILQIQLGPG